jgi:hypothetical protein
MLWSIPNRAVGAFTAVVGILLLLRSRSCAASELDLIPDDTRYDSGGLQSGPDLPGSTFATAIVYNKADNTLLITGSTFGTFFRGNDDDNRETFTGNGRCFLATVQLSNPKGSAAANNTISWLHAQTIEPTSADAGKVNEACTAILHHHTPKMKRTLLAGRTSGDGGGSLNDLYNAASSIEVAQAGLLMELTHPSSTTDTTSHSFINDESLIGGQVL